MRYFTYTDRGDRENNEDSIGISERGQDVLFTLADGLGGHRKGEVASGLVVSIAEKEFYGHSELLPQVLIQNVFRFVHTAIRQDQAEETSRDHMMSTAVIVICGEKNITVGNIGDSRAYLFSQHKMLWRTTDHSVPQKLALAGLIKEEEIRHHPARNNLLQALGDEEEDLKFDIQTFPKTRKLKGILLCSDGFWEYITEKEMLRCLRKSDSPKEWLEKMLTIVRENSKTDDRDNCSAIVVLP